jgi:hypothetical protein
MQIELDKIFPEQLTDKEISHIADVFMELALAIESHYYPQLRRYNKSLEDFEHNDEFPF